MMSELRACGVLVFRREPSESFLLMKHPTRWDLPKGHVDDGETEIQCAVRELEEETGLSVDDIELDPEFRFVTNYEVQTKRVPGGVAHKTVLIYLGWLRKDKPIQLTEHVGYEWFEWDPPHRIQPETIDPLLEAIARHFDDARA